MERPRRNSPANIPADVHGNWKRGGGWNEEESRRGGVLRVLARSRLPVLFLLLPTSPSFRLEEGRKMSCFFLSSASPDLGTVPFESWPVLLRGIRSSCNF